MCVCFFGSSFSRIFNLKNRPDATSVTLVLATSVRHAHPVRMSSAPTTPGCVLRYRHRPRARGEKTAGVLKMGRPPGFWAFWAETVAKTHRHAFAWPSGSGCCLGTCIWPTLPSSSHGRHLLRHLQVRRQRWRNGRFWGLGPVRHPRRPSDATAANFKSSSSGALKLGGEGRNITVARPTKLERVARGTFEVVPN